MNSRRLTRKYPILRTATILALVILSLPSLTTLNVRGQAYNMKYDLGYNGTPFPSGIISIVSNLTNIGQLTIRVTSVLFASDLWSNGTRQIYLGLSFNLTAGMEKEIDTPVVIPQNAFIGNHVIDATAIWQYSNSSGWFNATPVQLTKTVLVSQTIGSLFSSVATILLIGLGVAAVVVVLVMFLVIKHKKKPNPEAPFCQQVLSRT
jgi:hypothetical protein